MPKSLDIIDPKKDLESMEPQTEKQTRDDLVPEKSGRGGHFYLIIGIIAVLVAVLAALYILFKNDNKSQQTTSATQSATVTAAESASASVTETASQTQTAATAATTSSFTYTDEKIRIANGNGISGEAAKVKTLLVNAGFKIASTGNATKTYSSTIIYYKTGQDNLANALKDTIKSLYAGEIQKSDSIVGSYDAVIALGAK